MGLDIHQHAIVGIKLSSEDIKKVISPAIYEDQPRYDTKTGELKRYERVLVKEEKSVFAIGPYEFRDQWSINFKKDNKQVLGVRLLEGNIYIGLDLPISKAVDVYAMGDYLNGSISLMKLESVMVEVENKLFNLGLSDLANKVQLHFFTNISY